MKELKKFAKKQKWFKVGKWKEPVFLQEMVTRFYLSPNKATALPYHTTSIFVAGYKQFIPNHEYQAVKEKISQAMVTDPKKNFEIIRKEVDLAIKKIDHFNPKKITRRIIQDYVDLVKIHGWQSFRFIFLGYALEELYPKTLPKNFVLRGKKFTPQLLLAQTAFPKKISPMIEENLSLLKIAVKIKNHKPVTKDLISHAEKFSWMNSICWWDEPFTVEYYRQKAEIMAKVQPEKEIKKIILKRQKYLKNIGPVLNDLKNKYPKAWLYIDLTREMTDWREASWDAVSQAGVRLRPLFKRFAARHYLSYNQLMMLTINEMLRLAENKFKINTQKLNQRLNCFSLFGESKNINSPIINSGKNVLEFEKILEGKKPELTELPGLTIWPGKTSGKVRLLQSADEISLVKKDEILVCPMTDPDYMPAIYLAKAIVTDQGGLLCHAAIVARELKKICLVGTQQATKIFKTGDRIIVDADHGLVKKIK